MPITLTSVRLSLEAFNGSGKTTCAFTAPTPSVAFCFDVGWEGALFGAKAAYFKGLDIEVLKYEPGRKASKDDWAGHDITIYELPPPINKEGQQEKGKRELWQWASERMALILDDEYVKTCIIDTGTAARRIRVDAHLQLQQENAVRQNHPPRSSLIQIEYGVPNDSIKDIWMNFAGRKNLVMTHHLTEERKDVMETDARGAVKVKEGVPTGNYLLEGYTKTYDQVDIALRLTGEVKSGDAHVHAVFQKCRYNMALKGAVMEDITWNSLMGFIEVGLGDSIVFPKSRIPVK